MKKLLKIISLIMLVFAETGQGNQHKTGFIGPVLTLSVNVKDLVVDCAYSKGKGFFSLYAEKDGHLYAIDANSPLPSVDCDALVVDVKRVFKGADVVTISGWNRCDGYKEPILENALLEKFDGEVYEIALFSQISNGKTCKCWFEGCKCLPGPG